MKIIILFSVLLLAVYCTMAQVVVTPQLPPQGLTLKSQLWNLSLINTSGKDLMVQLQLTMTDIANRQKVLVATTRMFNLPKGIKQVSGNEILPVTYNAINPAYNMDAGSNGFLPVGMFTFCYAVIVLDEVKDIIAEDCQEARVEPLAPPMLISPADSEEIEPARPSFIWTPPAPGTLFNSLSYDLRLTEIIGTQTAAEALQHNIPLIAQYDIPTTNFQYAVSFPALDSLKLYAWQVIAKNGASPVAASEAWSFRVRRSPSDTVVVARQATYYTRLSLEDNPAFTVSSGLLRYAYLHEVNTRTIHLALYDITGNGRKQLTLDVSDPPVRFGDNLLTLDLRAVSGMSNKHFYLLDLLNSEGQHWRLKFEYKK